MKLLKIIMITVISITVTYGCNNKHENTDTMEIATDEDFKEFIDEHNEKVQDRVTKINPRNFDFDDINNIVKSHQLVVYSNAATSTFLDEVEEHLSIPLPKSYRTLLTNIGLLRYGSDKDFSTTESYKMLPPHKLYLLSEALEKEWSIDWSKFSPDIKEHADKLVIFANGNYDQQETFYLCFDLRTITKESNEASIYLFSQEYWIETISSPEKFSYLTGNTIQTYLSMTSENIMSDLDNAIEGAIEN